MPNLLPTISWLDRGTSEEIESHCWPYEDGEDGIQTNSKIKRVKSKTEELSTYTKVLGGRNQGRHGRGVSVSCGRPTDRSGLHSRVTAQDSPPSRHPRRVRRTHRNDKTCPLEYLLPSYQYGGVGDGRLRCLSLFPTRLTKRHREEWNFYD